MKFHIKKEGTKWCVKNAQGKTHAEFDTKREAVAEVREAMKAKHSEKGKEEDENEGDDEKLEMKKSEMITEHKNLIKVLRSGSQEERDAEADRQQEELDEYTK